MLAGVATVVLVGVVAFLRRDSRWVGTSRRVTVELVYCDLPKPLHLHGAEWDWSPPGRWQWPKAWSKNTTHRGRMHFDSSSSASRCDVTPPIA